MGKDMARTLQSAFGAAMTIGRSGRSDGAAGVTIRERSNVAVASVAVRKGKAEALIAKIKTRTGLELPTGPRLVADGHLSFLWMAPGQWLAMADAEDGPAFAADLTADLVGLASITDQSDGRALIRVSGANVRDALAKGCMVDLHPSAFQVGDTAITPIALLTVQVTRLPDAADGATFELAVMRSFALNLWHWLEASAAEYGVVVI